MELGGWGGGRATGGEVGVPKQKGLAWIRWRIITELFSGQLSQREMNSSDIAQPPNAEAGTDVHATTKTLGPMIRDLKTEFQTK